MSDGALDSLHGREPQFMNLESVVRQDAGVERRCAGEVWLRRGVVVERGGGGVAARRVKGEEVGVDDTLVVVGAVYVAEGGGTAEEVLSLKVGGRWRE